MNSDELKAKQEQVADWARNPKLPARVRRRALNLARDLGPAIRRRERMESGDQHVPRERTEDGR